MAVKVFGEDFEVLLPVANQVAAILRGTAGGTDVKVEQIADLPFISVNVDLLQAGKLGLRPAEIHSVISAAIRGQEAGFVLEGDRRFDILVRFPDEFRTNPEALRRLPIPLPATSDDSSADSSIGPDATITHTAPRAIPLQEVASIALRNGPNQFSRQDGKRRIVVQANVRSRDLGSYVEEAQQTIASRVVTPAGVWLSWGGQFEDLLRAKTRLALVLPLCLFLIFILLFSTFNSVRDALLVFTAVPLALPGGVIALWLRDMPFSISAAVGFIALSGVAVLNGLVLISFINKLAQEKPLLDAVREGAVTRLRPVLTTALVASLGFVPMAFAGGTGAEVQSPLATVVIGGLVTATVLTLFVLPALCILVRGDQRDAAEET